MPVAPSTKELPRSFAEIYDELKHKIMSYAKGLLQWGNGDGGTSDLPVVWRVSSKNELPVTRQDRLSIIQRGFLALFTTMLAYQGSGWNLQEISRSPNHMEEKFAAMHTRTNLTIIDIACQLLPLFPADFGFKSLINAMVPSVDLSCSNLELIASDFIGRLYQAFNRSTFAKHLNMNFTRPRECAPPCQLRNQIARTRDAITVIDPACGTGGLLLRAGAACQNQFQNMILRGIDVVPFAVALANASLACLGGIIGKAGAVPEEYCKVMPLGNGRLGSLEILWEEDLSSDLSAWHNIADLVVMNPPFSRSSGSNRIFGTFSEQEQRTLGKKLKVVRAKITGRGQAQRALRRILFSWRIVLLRLMGGLL